MEIQYTRDILSASGLLLSADCTQNVLILMEVWTSASLLSEHALMRLPLSD